MSILRKCERTPASGDAPDLMFFCPGCQCGHGVWTTHSNGITGAIWNWNGSMDKPTFNPSLKVSHGAGVVCHSFVRDGKIQFLSDCTHKLAGQTVDLPEF